MTTLFRYELATRRIPFEEVRDDNQVAVKVCMKRLRPSVVHIPAAER